MKSVQSQVTALFDQALRVAFPSISLQVLVVKGNPNYGDYQCNNAFSLFKDHGHTLGFKTPRAVGETIKQHMPQNDILKEVIVAPQGFVTVKIATEWIRQSVAPLVSSEIKCTYTAAKRIVVDFSSPNIAKEMHVGHLRSTIIGEATCRVLEMCGNEVHRLNHVGDWGTQFGMLIEYMKETHPNFQDELPDISDLQGFYKASKKRFDSDETFKHKAQLSVVALQSGNWSARDAWQKICDVSRKAFDMIYERLDITVHERGESFYNSMLGPLAQELTSRGLCHINEGALCFFTPQITTDLPLIVVKSDGGYGYDSTDLAAIYHRLLVMRADWVIYITDIGQELHFHMIFDAAKQAGWHVPPKTQCDHMGFGVILGEDGKKFKTRSGETVKLSDLLDEAIERALQEIVDRVKGQEADGTEVFLKTPEEQADAATKLGIAAVRYFDLKQNRTTSYNFKYDRMLDPKGNTAVYLFYAYARLRAIQRKSSFDVSTIDPNELCITEPQERELALKLLRFADTIEMVLESLHLHNITDYLWELCTVFTQFYKNCQVLGTPEERSRLLLIEATRKVLKKTLSLLSIEPLERI